MTVHISTTRHHAHFGLSQLVDRIRTMLAVRSQRRDLERMDDHMLDDIGITRSEANREAARPAWDVPRYWSH